MVFELDSVDSISQMNTSSRVLVIDLDETLLRTDTLHEALLQLLASQPMELLRLVAERPRTKADFKAKVADHSTLSSRDLPVNQSVHRLISESRQNGRKVVLVSASDHRQVAQVAAELGLFDAAYGTGSPEAKGYNLGGKNKADFLIERYGEGQFDYIGDSATDLPVWQAAHVAYAVAPSGKLRAKAQRANVELIEVDAYRSRWRFYVKALRPHQWTKNVLVFLPILASQQFEMIGLAVLAFVLFSVTASSVYIFNDLVDLSADRAHQRKSERPFAAGHVPVSHGVILGLGCLAAAFALSIFVMPPTFIYALALYFAVTVAYSLSLKRKLIVDVVVLAGLYTMRIIAGGAATGIVPSPWLLAFSVFLFYALASVKRQAELIDRAGQTEEQALGRGYMASDVSIMQMISISSGQAAVLVFALYLYSPAVAELYTTPQILWLICPVLLYWLARIAILTHRGFMEDDPIVFAAKDRISLITAVTVILIVFAAEWNW